MAFTFNPRTDYPTPRVLNPPVEGYPYFEGADAFDARASGYSPRNAWLLAEASLLAYAHRDFISGLLDGQAGSPPLPGFQFRTVGDSVDSGCFLLHDSKAIIVVFRGTRVPGLQDPLSFLHSLTPHLQDVVTDLRFSPRRFAGGRVHGGILDAYRTAARSLPELLRDLAQDGGRSVWFAGHSLGGALATLAAAEFGDFQGLYTYGCPRVGDADFLVPFKGKPCFRVVHHDDFATRLPPPFPLPALPPVRYEHAGSLVYIDRDGRVDLGKDPGTLKDVLTGVIDWGDVFRNLLQGAGALGGVLRGGGKTHLLDVPIPRGAVTEHAPIYYAMFLKEALG